MATLPDYTRTSWVNDSAPAINASNLNKIENGIYDATEAIQVLQDKTIQPTDLPYATPSERGAVRVELVDNGDGTHTCNIWTTD
jgi:hypothetical protein